MSVTSSFRSLCFLWLVISSGSRLSAQAPVPLLRPDCSLLAPTSVPKLDRHTLPSPYSYQQLGLFCKLDVQLERRLRLPVVVRLGDVQQVDHWEGKGPLRLP